MSPPTPPFRRDNQKGMTSLSKKKALKSGSSIPIQSSDVTFESLGLKSRYITALPSRIIHPTSIQLLSIPSILTSCTPINNVTTHPACHNIAISRDVILRAETGSGKTLAMLLPLIQLLDTFVYDPKMNRNELGTQIVYIVPTRELAVQTGNVLEQILNKLTKPHWIVSTVLTGHDATNSNHKVNERGKNLVTSSSRQAEKARLRKGVCIVIGTPGRLLDHLRLTHTWSNGLKSTCKWIVVDEADRLGDMGFEPLVKEIVRRTFFTGSSNLDNEKFGERREGQALILASATAREDITIYAGVELRRPVFLNPNNKMNTKGTNNDSPQIKNNHTLTTPTRSRTKHYFVCLPTRQRLDALINLISKEKDDGGKVIVFVSCCDAVDYFYAAFSLKTSPIRHKLVGNKGDVQVHRLHGKMPQSERLAVLNTFAKEQEQFEDDKKDLLILFSTDVAARGVDFPSVTCTIQYDAPLDPNDYMHRAGRSGRRRDEEGKSYLVLMPSEKGLVERLEQRSGFEIKKKRILDKEEGDEMVEVEAVEKVITNNSTSWQKSFESWTLDTENTISLAHKPPHTSSTTSYTPDKHSHSEEKIGIHDLAVKAFTGTLRAYATHKSDMRDILHPKNLHLGHLAGCFGLAKAPTLLLNNNKKTDQQMVGKKRMSEKDRVDFRRAKLVAAKRKRVDGERTNNLAFIKKQRAPIDSRVSSKGRVGRSRMVSEFGAGDY